MATFSSHVMVVFRTAYKDIYPFQSNIHNEKKSLIPLISFFFSERVDGASNQVAILNSS